MSVEILEQTGKKFIEVDVTGELTKGDYETFKPRMERLIAEYGKIRLLVLLHHFHGWTAAAFWEEIKFDVKHFSDIERIAFIGDEKWEKGMSTFCKPLTRAEVRFFASDKISEAKSWLDG